MIPGHTKNSCKAQWERTQEINTNKSSWSDNEDKQLRKVVECKGTKHWSEISAEFNKHFPTQRRTRKQCRDRWLNYLDPSISR
jgi:hypothetical protein